MSRKKDAGLMVLVCAALLAASLSGCAKKPVVVSDDSAGNTTDQKTEVQVVEGSRQKTSETEAGSSGQDTEASKGKETAEASDGKEAEAADGKEAEASDGEAAAAVQGTDENSGDSTSQPDTAGTDVQTAAVEENDTSDEDEEFGWEGTYESVKGEKLEITAGDGDMIDFRFVNSGVYGKAKADGSTAVFLGDDEYSVTFTLEGMNLTVSLKDGEGNPDENSPVAGVYSRQ